MNEDQTKDKERNLPCLKCDTETFHKVLKSINEVDSGEWGLFWGDFEIIMCQGCRTVSFRHAWGNDDIIDVDEDGHAIHDSSQALYPGRLRGRKHLEYSFFLPPDVVKIYKETHKALCSEQPILAGMGIRALVEAVCAEKKTSGKDLQERIDNLLDLGVLTKDVAEVLHHTRLYGNRAAHETASIKEADLSVLMDIAENLLRNVYILPKKAAQLKAQPKASPKNPATIPDF
ncbi:DUF4145 domain-containing protein [Candidatus Nomurabacteria bacterium]|nr:DUF4145 domain-containing protein [Candidatus Nomurabacteria bacterium]